MVKNPLDRLAEKIDQLDVKEKPEPSQEVSKKDIFRAAQEARNTFTAEEIAELRSR